MSSPEPLAQAGIANSDPHYERRWWILAVVAIAQLVVVLDVTVVNIALPSAQHALGFGNGDRQWVVTAYALAFGSLLLLGGRLADLLGRKRMFLIGLVGFAVASAVGGASTGFDTLVVARAVQGAFGAMLAPAALSLLATTFTVAAERARAFALYSAIAGAGAAIGLLLGGILTEYLSWRWCMFINVFFAAAAFTGGALLPHNSRALDRPKLDIPSAITVSAGLFGLVYGFSHAETAGWSSPVTLASLAAGLVLLVAFVALQSRVARPLLPLRVVLDRNRGGAYLAIFTVGTGVFGMFLFVTYYLQQTPNFSAVQSGLAFLPMTGALVIAAWLAPMERPNACRSPAYRTHSPTQPWAAPVRLVTAVAVIRGVMSVPEFVMNCLLPLRPRTLRCPDRGEVPCSVRNEGWKAKHGGPAKSGPSGAAIPGDHLRPRLRRRS